MSKDVDPQLLKDFRAINKILVRKSVPDHVLPLLCAIMQGTYHQFFTALKKEHGSSDEALKHFAHAVKFHATLLGQIHEEGHKILDFCSLPAYEMAGWDVREKGVPSSDDIEIKEVHITDPQQAAELMSIIQKMTAPKPKKKNEGNVCHVNFEDKD